MEKPRLPVVGEYVRMYGELIEVQDVTPPVTKIEDWIFRDTTARVEMRVNGKCVEAFSEHNNFNAKDACVPNAIASAKKRMAYFGPCDIEFVVIKVTSYKRMRPTGHAHFYAREFSEFESLPHGACWNAPEDTEEVVWSSKTGMKA